MKNNQYGRNTASSLLIRSKLKPLILLSILMLCLLYLSSRMISAAPTANEIVRTSVSGCYQNSGSKATVSVVVDWDWSSETEITVSLGSETRVINKQYDIIALDGVWGPSPIYTEQNLTSLQEIAFEIDADGSTGHTIQVQIGTETLTSAPFDAPPPCNPIVCNASSHVGGMVYNDYNLNGVHDAGETNGIAGVTVTAFDSAGTAVATTQTNNYGLYLFDSITAFPLRLEFTDIDQSLYFGTSTKHGSGNGTTVQFISGYSCGIDLGANDPLDYCQEDPLAMTSVFVNGDPLKPGTDPAQVDASTTDAIVGFPYSLSGLKDTNQMTTLADGQTVGSLWGLAYDRYTESLYTSAVLRRHSGLGPLGLGGIYVTDLSSHTLNNNNSVATTSFIDVTTLGVDVGSISDNSTRGLPGDVGSGNHDIEAFDKITKTK